MPTVFCVCVCVCVWCRITADFIVLYLSMLLFNESLRRSDGRRYGYSQPTESVSLLIHRSDSNGDLFDDGGDGRDGNVRMSTHISSDSGSEPHLQRTDN
jgi:hypothetical protein